MWFCFFALVHAGLLVDLIKECVQSAANGASWSRLAYRPPGGLGLGLGLGLRDGAQEGGWFQRRGGGSKDPAAVKVMLRRMFKPPTSKQADDTNSASVITDVDQLVLAGTKKKRTAQQQRLGGAGDTEEDDLFVDLRTGSADLGPEKLIEVREALPFMWASNSPFWSPLLLRRGLLEPLRELTHQGTAEKVSVQSCVILLCALLPCSSAK